MNIKDKVNDILKPKIDRYINYSIDDLKVLFKINSKAKNINHLIISKMIDLTELDNETVLFLKKHSVFKTVNVQEDNKVKESMSFPSIDYFNMIKNDWENSAVYKYFSSRVIVIFIFKTVDNIPKFMGAIYLLLSNDELAKIFLVWKKVKNMVINNELVLGGQHGFSVENFPKKNENLVTHIRPHDRDTTEGRVLLPNGKRIINYCFWLNNTFIENKIKGVLL